jgi:Ca2+-binding EF-hand superfamily protein
VKGFKTAPPAVQVPGGRQTQDMVTLEVGNTVVELRLASGGVGGMMFFPDSEQFYKMQFNAADQDNNGYLDMNEARRSVFGGLFKQMDADGDGKLYLKEVLAFVRKQKVLKEKASACCLSLSVSDQGRGLFDLLDTNGDGRLSVREMRNAVKLLDRLDRNGDGTIDRSEIPRRYAAEARRGPSGGGGGRGAFVVAYGAPPMIRRAPPRQAGPLWFHKMDRNGDGDVSRKEWLGSEELFKKIDTDGDGLISVEEAIKADALMRKKK